MEKKVADSMNARLLSQYTAKEVTMDLKQMHPTKVLCRDGMSPIFFQSYWHILGKDVISDVLDVLNNKVGSFIY